MTAASFPVPVFTSAALTAALGLALLAFSSAENLGGHSVLVALNVILLLYLWLETSRLRALHPHRWLLNPVVFCSLMTFGLAYGVSNFIFFLPPKLLRPLGVVYEISPAMVKLMYLVLLGAIAMWLGYWSPLAARLSRPETVNRFQQLFLPRSNNLKSLALPALMILSVASRLLAIQLGIFGYASSYEKLVAASNYTQYISLLSGVGKLGLVLASLRYYTQVRNRANALWMYVFLLTEVVFGFLSGFKSAVAMPFIIVGLSAYLAQGRVRKTWIVYAIVGIAIAFQVIEPYREASRKHSQSTDSTLSGIANLMIESASSGDREARQSQSLVLNISIRQNLTYIGSFGIQYADRNPELPEGSPAFLENILLAPLHAWIPRFIWESKPLGNLGLWYTRAVMKRHYSYSSTAMGPFTYLYLAGGALAVFIGFFCIGILQRLLFYLLTPASSLAGGAIFLAMLSPVVLVDSAVNSLVVTLFRQLPIFVVLLNLLIDRQPRGTPQAAPVPAGVSALRNG